MDFILIILARLLGIYSFILIIRVLITWIPNLDPYNPIVQVLFQITDPILEPMRGLLPPMGGMDFSPILAFLLIRVAQSTLLALAGVS